MNKSDDLISRQAVKAKAHLFFGHSVVFESQIDTLPSAEPKTGECRTCKRNADNGGVYEDGRTKCPIQEHYALLLDGYCHLYEQI